MPAKTHDLKHRRFYRWLGMATFVPVAEERTNK